MMYRKITKLLLLTMIISITVSIFSMSAYGEISDISDYWAKEVIREWVEKGRVKGYPDDTFRPKNDISRAEFMILVNNAFGFREEAEIDYIDIEMNAWYSQHIRRAKAAGYISGYNDKTIKPNNPITREEVAVVISRLMKLEPNENGVEIFKDKNEITWSKGYVGVVSTKKYMVGFLDQTFKPRNNITRGEAIYALNNLIIEENEAKGIHAVAKQDFLGITYIQVKCDSEVKPSKVKANGKELIYDTKDGKWKGTALDLKLGDVVEILAVENGMEVKEKVIVKDILDD